MLCTILFHEIVSVLGSFDDNTLSKLSCFAEKIARQARFQEKNASPSVTEHDAIWPY